MLQKGKKADIAAFAPEVASGGRTEVRIIGVHYKLMCRRSEPLGRTKICFTDLAMGLTPNWHLHHAVAVSFLFWKI